jgi:hypothetical protein
MTPQTINIKCPSCGVVLKVTNSKNEPVKRFACPKCAKPILVPFYKLRPEDGETQMDGKGEAQSTQLASSELQQSCNLTCGGKEYELAIGSYSIGRQAVTSTADIQIDTDDLYMSREHAMMNVRRLADGGIKVDISNLKNKNTTLVNDYMLQPGDAIVVHDGDTIKMGNTIVTVHIK